AHADHLQGAHIGGQKCQAGDPQRERVARGEEVRTRTHALAQEPSNAQDKEEVNQQNRVVEWCQRKRHRPPPENLYPIARWPSDGSRMPKKGPGHMAVRGGLWGLRGIRPFRSSGADHCESSCASIGTNSEPAG